MAPRMETRSPNQGRGLNVGDVVPAHVHLTDHTAVFSNGRWRILTKTKQNYGGRMEWPLKPTTDEVHDAPFTLLVRGSVWHEFHYLGQIVPDWMKAHLAALSPEAAEAIRYEYEHRPGFVHCVFPGEAK